jgi:SAM-dependent methyltransferase
MYDSLDNPAYNALEERKYSTEALTRLRNATRARIEGHTLLGDLAELADPSRLGELRGTFDIIVCQQVFEHVARPFHAALGLYHLLRPGGVVFWSAPFLERAHGVPNDFFRYTEGGARQIFSDAGLDVESIAKVGDTYLTSGAVLSLGTGDFDPSHLQTRLLQNFTSQIEYDPAEWLYASVVLVARKPLASH